MWKFNFSFSSRGGARAQVLVVVVWGCGLRVPVFPAALVVLAELAEILLRSLVISLYWVVVVAVRRSVTMFLSVAAEARKSKCP